jgi:broad specificity phosphatase PhoE
MIRTYLIFCLAIFAANIPATAQTDEIFTIYLVRHSEKDMSSADHSDLPLSTCGEERSEALSNFLSDVPLDAIYSTEYTRTVNTALPTATAKGLEIQSYTAQGLPALALSLLEKKENALVVGHSNTTGYLAGLLTDEEGEDISLEIYDRIYKVVVSGGTARLHLLHSSFECDE